MLAVQKNLNNKKIAFILAVNNELYYEECLWYLQQLTVPTGYETDIIAVREAKSMAEAYNAAMESSDAKYKVYLHQDVFIYYRDIIVDIIKIFEVDNKLGLIGVLGGRKIPKNAVAWNAWDCGHVYANYYKNASILKCYQDKNLPYVEVEAIDGMLMATQYDIKWREDLELGWDFYDVTQSLEFKRNGYKIGIPYQETPWCMHDCGWSKLHSYEKARKVVLENYKEFFSDSFELLYQEERFEIEEQLYKKIRMCIEQRRFDVALEIKKLIDKGEIKNNNLIYGWNFLEIYEEEKNLDDIGSFFYGIYVWDDLKVKYDTIKFIIRHVENRTYREVVEDLLKHVKAGFVSMEAVCLIAYFNTIEYENVCKELFGKEGREFIAYCEMKKCRYVTKKMQNLLMMIENLPQKDGIDSLYEIKDTIIEYLNNISNLGKYFYNINEVLKKTSSIIIKELELDKLYFQESNCKKILDNLKLLTKAIINNY